LKIPFPPMLATLVEDVPTGRQWVYEEKYDGIRTVAARRNGKVRMWSRTLQDLTKAFAGVARDIEELPGGDLVLDGEVVVFDPEGVSRFQLLQRRGAGGRLVYAVFDCLERSGRDLWKLPLGQRREALDDIVPRRRATLMRSRRLSRDGTKAYAQAKALGWEGIIAKDERSPYEIGRRSRSWLKVKVRKESEFVIGGFTAPKGSREHLGALLVGLFEDDHLRYTGKVGTGYTRDVLADLSKQLGPLVTERSPFEPAPRMKDATWVRPRLVAQITYAEWTSDGKLRQPAFLGLRTDKRPRDVRWGERER
jgi:bifunctional non-homologous end joining protein LigD